MFDLPLCKINNRITVVLLCTAVLLCITSYLLLCFGEEQDSLDFSCEPYFLAHHCSYYLPANIRLNLVLLMSLCQEFPWILDRAGRGGVSLPSLQLLHVKVEQFKKKKDSKK